MSGNRKQEHWWKKPKKKNQNFIFKMCVSILIFLIFIYLVNVYLVIISDNLFDRSRFVLVTIARLMRATLKHVPWLNRIKMDNFSSRLCTLRLLLVWGFRLRRPDPTFDHRDRVVQRRRKTMKMMTWYDDKFVVFKRIGFAAGLKMMLCDAVKCSVNFMKFFRITLLLCCAVSKN